MKLNSIHLFLILLFVLILGCTSLTQRSFYEGYTSSTVTGPAGNSATVATGKKGNTAVVTNSGEATLIKKSDIPQGDEDLYVLKSSIVPPVCPACPSTAVCEREKPCPACPPCARCPEPAFECKKVPNYTSNNDRYLPKPVLTDFSTFGS